MTDLAEIPVSHLLPAARQFRNWRFHRVYVLEGLARTAHRNMRHMVEAMDRLGPRVLSHTPGGQEEWIDYVQAEMLRDHGFAREDARLRMPSFSTTLPVELYCAVLSAEAEFLRKPPSHLDGLIDDNAKRLLDEHRELIDQLRSFRNGFLKPQASTVLAKENLFNGEFANGVPALLPTIDRIMAQVRHVLRSEVERVLAQLPRAQANLCRFMHIQRWGRNSLMNPLIRESPSVRDTLRQAMARVLEDARRHPAEVDRLELSEQASRKALSVVELLNSVSDYDEMVILGDIPKYDTLQPPFEPAFLTPLADAQGGATLGLALHGRTAAHIAAHMGHYMTIVLVSRLAANEVHQLLQKVAGSQSVESIEDMISASEDVPAEEAVRVTSLHFVQASMLTHVLRVYQSVRVENPHAAVPALDQIIDDRRGFAALNTFRNSIFHVERKAINAEERDDASLRKVSTTEFLSDATAGVEQFLTGVRLGTVERVVGG